MFVCDEGFIFTGKKDREGNLGVLESFSKSGSNWKITCGITAEGIIAPAYYFTSEKVFCELGSLCKTPEDVEFYFRSMRGIYAKMGVACYLVEYYTKNGDVDIYVPKMNVNADGTPAVACQKVSPVGGFNIFKVNSSTYEMLLNGIRREFSKLDTTSRLGFYSSRIIK